jgi:hypothetical protein
MLAGALLLWNPLHSLAMLTYVLVGFFIIDGLLTIMLAIAHRRSLSGRWEWLMVNGVIDLFLAGIILSGVPGTLVWALGLIVGIDMVFGGASLIAISRYRRGRPPGYSVGESVAQIRSRSEPSGRASADPGGPAQPALRDFVPRPSRTARPRLPAALK